MVSGDNYPHPIHLSRMGSLKEETKSIAEVARAMLFENDVPKTFWREVVNTVVC